MKVIFYDRKNKREVSSDQLMKINLCQSTAGIDDEGFAPGTAVKKLTDKYGDEHLFIRVEQIGTYGYKSEKAHSSQNWDLWLNEPDLLFLRLEP